MAQPIKQIKRERIVPLNNSILSNRKINPPK